DRQAPVGVHRPRQNQQLAGRSRPAGLLRFGRQTRSGRRREHRRIGLGIRSQKRLPRRPRRSRKPPHHRQRRRRGVLLWTERLDEQISRGVALAPPVLKYHPTPIANTHQALAEPVPPKGETTYEDEPSASPEGATENSQGRKPLVETQKKMLALK